MQRGAEPAGLCRQQAPSPHGAPRPAGTSAASLTGAGWERSWRGCTAQQRGSGGEKARACSAGRENASFCAHLPRPVPGWAAGDEHVCPPVPLSPRCGCHSAPGAAACIAPRVRPPANTASPGGAPSAQGGGEGWRSASSSVGAPKKAPFLSPQPQPRSAPCPGPAAGSATGTEVAPPASPGGLLKEQHSLPRVLPLAAPGS